MDAPRFTPCRSFDDYITFCRESEVEATEIAVRQFFSLLGWQVSSGGKDAPFFEKFKALGIKIDCSQWDRGEVSFGRTTELVAGKVRP